MAQSKILIDTNTYIRLAKSIHPLLDVNFGQDNHCLYVLKELDEEFSCNKRLKTQFTWVDDDEFLSNRKKRLTLSRKDKNNIQTTIEFLHQHKIDYGLSVSRVDILCLAHAYVLDIHVVTDDTDMLELAKTFGIKTMKTLELLGLMLECCYVDMPRLGKSSHSGNILVINPLTFARTTPGYLMRNHRRNICYVNNDQTGHPQSAYPKPQTPQ